MKWPVLEGGGPLDQTISYGARLVWTKDRATSGPHDPRCGYLSKTGTGKGTSTASANENDAETLLYSACDDTFCRCWLMSAHDRQLANE